VGPCYYLLGWTCAEHKYTEPEIHFDLSEIDTSTIKGGIVEHLQMLTFLKYEEILRYIRLPKLPAQPQSKGPTGPGLGRSTGMMGEPEISKLFNWIRFHKVKKILKIVVEDRAGIPHSDQVIENCLNNFDVEIWDWRKLDLCSYTILAAAPKVRVLYLYSSGNRAVLQSWCSTSGLRILERVRYSFSIILT